MTMIEVSSLSPQARVALAVSQRWGVPVFPLRPGTKNPLGRLVPHGKNDATTDVDTILDWIREEPNANWAGRTDGPSPIRVMDVDAAEGHGKDGWGTLAQLEVKYGAIPDTPRTVTPSGGAHYVFQTPIINIATVKTDVWGEGLDSPGYIVLPGSVHPNGGRYEWDAITHPEDLQIAPMPQWMVILAARKNSEPRDKQLLSGAEVGEFVSLWIDLGVDIDARDGREQKRRCPFHDDQHASLSINVSYGLWNCFVCGGGALGTLRRKVKGELARENPSKSRNTHIRDFEGFSESVSPAPEPEEPALEPTLADIATERAAQFKDFAKEAIPILPEMDIQGSSSLFRNKDDGTHLVTHAGLSDTWQIEGNAQYKRQRYLAFYTAGFQWLLREQEGALYLLRYHLHPDSIDEDRTNLRRLRQRINAKGGQYLEATCLYEEEEGGGCYVHLYTDTFDRKMADLLIVPTAADLIDTFTHTTKIPEVYGRKHPVRASDEWRMRRARTGEWEAVGTRAIYDLASYEEAVDKADEEKAAKWGIKTWKASEQELMARSPESIMHTRHFHGRDAGYCDEEMLVWAQGLGFRLFPHAQDEVDAILDPKALERRLANRAMRKQEGR